jgi:hypothetical protein
MTIRFLTIDDDEKYVCLGNEALISTRTRDPTSPSGPWNAYHAGSSKAQLHWYIDN